MYFSKHSLRFSLQKLSPLIVIMIGTSYLNWHFWIANQDLPGGIKSLPLGYENFSLIMLAWGRYWMNLFVPFYLTTNYYPYSIINTLGIGGLLFWIFICKRYLLKTLYLPWLIYFFLIPATVTFNMTSIFISDTYILHVYFVFIILLFFIFKLIFSKRSFVIFSLIVIILEVGLTSNVLNPQLN